MEPKFERNLKRNLTERSVWPSATRGQVEAGGLQKLRDALCGISVKDLASLGSRSDFEGWLHGQTDALLQETEEYSVMWGTARKSLNLWLRDLVYNHHFRAVYRLERLEPWLEVPLDRHSAEFIAKQAVRLNIESPSLPRWKSISELSEEASEAYQQAARKVVRAPEFSYLQHAIHIDLVAWRSDDTMRDPKY